MAKNDDQVQVLNYCAHAIESLLEQERVYRHQMPETANAVLQVVSLLQRSVKFILPNGCNLIEPDDIKQSHLDLTRLPYPCVAFEAPWILEHNVEVLGGIPQAQATKRIALCWEAGLIDDPFPKVSAGVLGQFPQGGIFVLPVFWGATYRQWVVPIGGTFVPYGSTFSNLTMDDLMPASRQAHQAFIDAGLTTYNAKQCKAEPFSLMPELFENSRSYHDGDPDRVFSQIIQDSHDETWMLVQACSVLNCANVGTADVIASPLLNKKRLKNGKQPFFTYKVLQLTDERGGSGSKRGAGGSHASPRMHLRRGHVRRLESKSVWVRPTLVNPGSRDGVVVKDYAIITETEKQ